MPSYLEKIKELGQELDSRKYKFRTVRYDGFPPEWIDDYKNNYLKFYEQIQVIVTLEGGSFSRHEETLLHFVLPRNPSKDPFDEPCVDFSVKDLVDRLQKNERTFGMCRAEACGFVSSLVYAKTGSYNHLQWVYPFVILERGDNNPYADLTRTKMFWCLSMPENSGLKYIKKEVKPKESFCDTFSTEYLCALIDVLLKLEKGMKISDLSPDEIQLLEQGN